MYGTWGALSFPLNPADYTTSFAGADPARARMLALFKAAIEHELGAIWTTVTNTLPSGANAHPLRGSSVVEDTLEMEPIAKIMTERKGAFPLLALHRVDESTWANRTDIVRERAQNWHLHWILGTLEVGAARKLLDCSLLIEAIIEGVTQQQRHEAYAGGAVQFTSDDSSGLSSVKLTGRSGPGQARYGGDENGAIYWSVVFTLATVETGTNTGMNGSTGDPLLNGVTYDVGAGSPEGVFPSIVLADTDTILD